MPMADLTGPVVRWANVHCTACGEPMPKGSPIERRRARAYHPDCWALLMKEALTPPPF